MAALTSQLASTLTAKGEAHDAYLRFANRLTQVMTDEIALQTSLLASQDSKPLAEEEAPSRSSSEGFRPRLALDRDQCLEFAIGRIGNVLGADFAAIDAYPTRVRLPDEPLMLVDRIVEIEGAPRSLTPGRVVTEHDVHPGAWYLDANRAPACISVEAGQADLFLSGYLGIDFETKGQEVYRLLDAVVTFHRGLPKSGDVIRYDIAIDQFFVHAGTHFFRFRFDGTIDGELFLSMREGCAGFFSAAGLGAGRGIVQTELDRQPRKGKKPVDWVELVPLASGSYDDGQLAALRAGDLAGCFGSAFQHIRLSPPPLPDGRMKLIDRVLKLDPQGGRYELGLIRAEADIHPDDWFLTCHFIDDMVMPGTLMYECCLHTLRVFLLRMGWLPETESAWEPVPEVASRLKCRGQVIASTKKAVYEVAIKELGYRPEPFVLADAIMYADGKPIVEVTDMTLRLTGTDLEKLKHKWSSTGVSQKRQAIFDYHHILAFATGKPSEAFGEPYRIFDQERVIARLPGPPYDFLHRVVRTDAEPWRMAPGGVIVAEYDVSPNDWYFAAERQPAMPFAVLLEVALQPCGFLAAYMGSALTSPEDLSFRNLGGQAVQLRPVRPDAGTLATTVKITNVSRSGGMIIQNYDFEVRDRQGSVYRGDTYFGFFSKQALANQVGIREAQLLSVPEPRPIAYPHQAPFPDRMLRMMDRIDCYDPTGGPHGLGFIQGSKTVDPTEWFFKAHFHQDPVWPGSLGLEAFLQLMKYVTRQRFGAGATLVGSKPHRWTYRGQVLPTDREVIVQAIITAVDEVQSLIQADGLLSVDGRVIYQMHGFTMSLEQE